MVEFALTAEFHELGMDEPWKRLHERLQDIGSAVELQPRRVLDLGAGSGMGIPVIAKLIERRSSCPRTRQSYAIYAHGPPCEWQCTSREGHGAIAADRPWDGRPRDAVNR